MKQIISIILTATVLSILFVLFFKVPISEGGLLRSLRVLKQLIFPPKDLYDLVVNEEISISDSGASARTRARQINI